MPRNISISESRGNFCQCRPPPATAFSFFSYLFFVASFCMNNAFENRNNSSMFYHCSKAFFCMGLLAVVFSNYIRTKHVLDISYLNSVCTKPVNWNTSHLAGWETRVSRHNGGTIYYVPYLKPLNTIVLWWSEGFQGVSSIRHTWLARDANLSLGQQ